MPDQAVTTLISNNQLSRRSRDIANAAFLEETGVSKLVRASIYTGLAAVVIFFAWAHRAPIQEIVMTAGYVVPRNKVRTIQHLEGGIISEILVKTGQRVEVGDPLVRLDASTARAELGQYEARLAALMLEEERLRAYADNREAHFDGVPQASGYDELKADQARILTSERNARGSQAAVLDKQVQEREATLKGLMNERRSVAAQLDVLKEEFAIQRQLFKKGLKPRLDFLSAKQNLMAAESSLQRIQDQISATAEGVAEIKERRLDLDSRLRQEAMRSLGSVTAARAEVEKVIVSLKDRVDRLVVSTPVPGIVQSLPLQANAGVLPPGGVVAEIVPVDDGFIVESRVQTRDIGFLEVGQPVTVKIDAFDYARYGSIPGRLTELSPTTFLDEQNRPYYQAKIEIEKIYVGPNPQENAFMPGMTVQGDIATGDRTVLQYLLKPLYTVVNEAFWER